MALAVYQGDDNMKAYEEICLNIGNIVYKISHSPQNFGSFSHIS